jgi:hypothetical protein
MRTQDVESYTWVWNQKAVWLAIHLTGSLRRGSRLATDPSHTQTSHSITGGMLPGLRLKRWRAGAVESQGGSKGSEARTLVRTMGAEPRVRAGVPPMRATTNLRWEPEPQLSVFMHADIGVYKHR